MGGQHAVLSQSALCTQIVGVAWKWVRPGNKTPPLLKSYMQISHCLGAMDLIAWIQILADQTPSYSIIGKLIILWVWSVYRLQIWAAIMQNCLVSLGEKWRACLAVQYRPAYSISPLSEGTRTCRWGLYLMNASTPPLPAQPSFLTMNKKQMKALCKLLQLRCHKRHLAWSDCLYEVLCYTMLTTKST